MKQAIFIFLFLLSIKGHSQDAYHFFGQSKQSIIDIVGYDFEKDKSPDFGERLIYVHPKQTKDGIQFYGQSYHFKNSKCWRITYVQPLFEYFTWVKYFEAKFIKVAGNRFIMSGYENIFWDIATNEKLVTIDVYAPDYAK